MEQPRNHEAQNAADAVDVGKAAQRHMDGQGASIAQVSLSDMVAVMVRLAQVLAEEVDFLDEMKIREIEGLQDEKRKLTRSLTVMKRRLERDPFMLQEADEEELESFHQVAEVFDEVLKENHRKLLVAKEINYRMVQAISDVVEEENLRPGYSRKGSKARQKDRTPSVSLNQTI